MGMINMVSNWGFDEDFEALASRQSSLYAQLRNKSVLITGATGLVGTALTEFLVYMNQLEDGNINITVLSSSLSNINDRFSNFIKDGKITALVQDIRNPIDPSLHFDYIIHAASVANPKLYEEAPVDVIDITLQGTRNVLEYCRNVNTKCRVVYTSSVEVYGETKDISPPITEDKMGYVDPFMVRSSYTESKRAAETLCKAYFSQYNVDCSVARLSKTYGPSNSKTDNRIMAYILESILGGKDIVLNSDGTRVFSFCYVTDAVSAILTIMLAGTAGEVYNVSDKDSVASLKEIAQVSAEIANVSLHLQPSNIAAISKDTVVDSSKLEEIGWQPLTNIHSGLKKQYYGLLNK